MFCGHPCPTLTYYCGLVSVSQWPLKLFLKVFKRFHSAHEWLVPGARWSPSVTFLSELAPSNDVCCLPGAQIFPGDDFKWLWHQPQEVPMLLGLAVATVITPSGLCNATAHCALRHYSRWGDASLPSFWCLIIHGSVRALMLRFLKNKNYNCCLELSFSLSSCLSLMLLEDLEKLTNMYVWLSPARTLQKARSWSLSQVRRINFPRSVLSVTPSFLNLPMWTCLV